MLSGASCCWLCLVANPEFGLTDPALGTMSTAAVLLPDGSPHSTHPCPLFSADNVPTPIHSTNNHVVALLAVFALGWFLRVSSGARTLTHGLVSVGTVACAFACTNVEAIGSLVHFALTAMLSWAIAGSFNALERVISGSIDAAVVPWDSCELILSVAVALVPNLLIMLAERLHAYRERKRPYQVLCCQLDCSSVTLEVCAVDTIGDIKKRLEHKIGVPAGLHYLVWSGKDLDDSHSLFRYGIKKEATLHLRTQLRGGGPKSHGGTSTSTADAAGAQTWTALC